MPISAEFEADFNRFLVGAKEADAALAELEARSGTLSGARDAARQGIDFNRLFSDPLKEATQFGDTFAAPLPLVAQGALAAAGGAVALGQALNAMAADAAASAVAIGD